MALDDPVRSGPLDDATAASDFIRLRSWVKNSLSKHAKWYDETRECYDFVAGRQWSDDDKLAMQATKRQPIEFNRVGPIVDAICGMEVNNRQEVKYLPRTLGNSQVNERLTSLGEWAREECQAEDEESAAFRDAVICGRGWTETRLDFEEEPTGKIVVDRIDPLEAGVDPSASKANFADARYLFRFRDLDTDDAEAMFPGVAWQALNAGWARIIDIEDGGEGYKRDYPEETRSALKEDRKPETVRVVQIQWWDRAKAYMVAMPGGEPQQVSADDFEKAKTALESVGQPVPQAQEVWVRQYKQAFLGSSAILSAASNDADGSEAIEEISCFSLAAVTGRWDRNKRYHYGVVRPMMNPQMLANKMLSQVLHILNTNAKGGLLAEKGAFANPRDAEQDWSDPGKTVLVADGALSGNRIQPRTPPPMPATLGVLQEFSISSIRDVVGVNVELLGQADREQAASLEYQRRQSAMAILAPLFDALRRYRKTQGHILIDCLRRLPPGVLVRVIQPQDMQPEGQPQQPGQQPQQAFQPFDPSYFGLDKEQDRFDVIVDEAPSSPNQKDQTWAALQPLLPGMTPQQQMVALKYSPLPLAAVQEIQQASGPQIPPELQQQMQEGQQKIADLTKENDALKADRSVDAAKVQTDQFKAQTDRIHKVGQLGGDQGHGSEVELLRLQLEQRFEAMEEGRKREFEALEASRKRDHEILMQHLKNAGQIAASRVRADATADQGIETNNEVGA